MYNSNNNYLSITYLYVKNKKTAVLPHLIIHIKVLRVWILHSTFTLKFKSYE